MKKNPSFLFESMISTLNDLQGLKENDTDSIIKAINTVAASISEVNNYLISYSFETESEEINFFKKIKPEFDGRMIFYLMLLKTTRHAFANDNERKSYYQSVFKGFQEDPFWLYFKMGYSYFDHQYFLRKADDSGTVYDEHQLNYDRRTNTLMSAKTARIIACDLFHAHTYSSILFRDGSIAENLKEKKDRKLQWAASVAAITELIYALHEYGVFGKNIEIKKMADYFSVIFDVRITNIYKTWEDIRLRKKDRTPFLRALLASLDSRIDHDNEFAP